MIKKKLVFVVLLLLSFMTTANTIETEPQYAKRGAATCLKCHDELPVTLINHTPHAQQADSDTPYAKHECESCHGASPQHIPRPEKGEKKVLPSIVFGQQSATPVAEQNKQCLSCHQQGLRMHWQGSQHQSADLACSSCHKIHIKKDPVLIKQTQAAVCFTCHGEQRAQLYRRSRHPIKEAKTICSDCHNPHGSSGEKLLVEETINETCYRCHAEKRGPFLWEHPPAQEDCSICHESHGATQPSLLKVRAPFLCQQCHSEVESLHANVLYDAKGVSSRGGQSRLLAKSCLNCHSNVHGSNHPSGVRFDR
jgi:DmsE family decaheme c-type cytochrome